MKICQMCVGMKAPWCIIPWKWLPVLWGLERKTSIENAFVETGLLTLQILNTLLILIQAERVLFIPHESFG